MVLNDNNGKYCESGTIDFCGQFLLTVNALTGDFVRYFVPFTIHNLVSN